MVIGNDKAGGGSGSHLVLAKGCGKTRDRFFWASQANFPLQLSTDGQSHASAQYCLAAKRLISRRLCAATDESAGARSSGCDVWRMQIKLRKGPKVLLGELSRRCYREPKLMTQFGRVRGMGASAHQRFGERTRCPQ